MEVRDFIFASLEKNIGGEKKHKGCIRAAHVCICQVGKNLFLVIGLSAIPL
jgi:hypothetical protein